MLFSLLLWLRLTQTPLTHITATHENLDGEKNRASPLNLLTPHEVFPWAHCSLVIQIQVWVAQNRIPAGTNQTLLTS